MDGWEYEKKCKKYLEANGYVNVSVTKGSNDDGVDIIAFKNGEKYAVQCKYYEGKVGKKAISEVYAGARSSNYNCRKCIVITNSTFTTPAKIFAADLGVEIVEGVDAIELEKAIHTNMPDKTATTSQVNIDLAANYDEKYKKTIEDIYERINDSNNKQYQEYCKKHPEWALNLSDTVKNQDEGSRQVVKQGIDFQSTLDYIEEYACSYTACEKIKRKILADDLPEKEYLLTRVYKKEFYFLQKSILEKRQKINSLLAYSHTNSNYIGELRKIFNSLKDKELIKEINQAIDNNILNNEDSSKCRNNLNDTLQRILDMYLNYKKSSFIIPYLQHQSFSDIQSILIGDDILYTANKKEEPVIIGSKYYSGKLINKDITYFDKILNEYVPMKKYIIINGEATEKAKELAAYHNITIIFDKDKNMPL